MPIAQPKVIDEKWLAKLREEISYREVESARVGRALVEYKVIESDCLKRIEESRLRQRGIGNTAISDAGIDPNSGEFTIEMETGRIVQYKDGKESFVF